MRPARKEFASSWFFLYFICRYSAIARLQHHFNPLMAFSLSTAGAGWPAFASAAGVAAVEAVAGVFGAAGTSDLFMYSILAEARRRFSSASAVSLFFLLTRNCSICGAA